MAAHAFKKNAVQRLKLFFSFGENIFFSYVTQMGHTIVKSCFFLHSSAPVTEALKMDYPLLFFFFF